MSGTPTAVLDALRMKRGHAYMAVVAEAVKLYRELDGAVITQPFWTANAEAQVRQAHQLEGMVMAAIAILKSAGERSKDMLMWVHLDIDELATAMAQADGATQ